MLDGIKTKLSMRKNVKAEQLGEASRVKKDYESAPKTENNLERSPKKDTFTSSSSADTKKVTVKK